MTFESDAKSFGGVKIRQLESQEVEVRYFASNPYEFFSIALGNGKIFRHSELDAYVVFGLAADKDAVVRVEGSKDFLLKGGSATVENNLSLKALGDGIQLLVVGSKRAQKRPDAVTITASGAHYKVSKPWGHELWINGEDPDICFKEIFLTTNSRTSLQYHNLKRETNLLVSGTAEVIYKARDEVGLDDVVDADLASQRIVPSATVDTGPRVLHRIVALSDALFYEASTPHVNDVIRVQDDTGRQHGRIKSEHAGNRRE